MPTTELSWGLAYALGSLVLCFYGTAWEARTVADQAAWLAVAQVPLIIALAGKNNLVSFLTGISYEKLNFLHRASGRVCLGMAWIHAIGYWYLNKGYVPGAWKTSLVRWGITGILAFSLMYLTSISVVRRKLYEFFLVTHICLGALTLAAFIMHWRAVDVWIYPGIGLWAGDRLFRIIRLIILNRLYPTSPPSVATLHLLTPSTLKITFPNPAHLKWSAGQHFYLILPGMSRLPWEAHPFTATTISGELTFIVRVRDGFTKLMKDKVDEERKARGLGIEEGEDVGINVMGVVEGPYGIGRDLSRFNGVLILAGGSGISFAVAHLLQIIREAREGKSKVSHVKVVWMVKSRLHLNWISPILLEHAQDLPPNLNISLHIHVTKHYLPRQSLSLPPTAVLPEDPASENIDWQSYMAKRAAAPPRRRSRLFSTFSWASWTSRGKRAMSGTWTRRGSEAVLPGAVSGMGSIRQLSRADTQLQVDLEVGDREKEIVTFSPPTGEPMPTFTWSEGYGDGFPSSAGPGVPTRARLASEVPSIYIAPLSPPPPDAIPTFAWGEGYRDGFPSSAGPVTPRRSRVASGVPSIYLAPLDDGDVKEDTKEYNDEEEEENEQERRDSVTSSFSTPPRFGSRRVSEVPRLSNDSDRPALDAINSSLSTPPRYGSRRVSEVQRMSSDSDRPILPLHFRQSLSIPHSPTQPRKSSITIDEPIHPRRMSIAPSALGSRRASSIPSTPKKESILLPSSLDVPTLSIELQPSDKPSTYLNPTSVEMTQTKSDTSILSIPQLPSGSLTPALSDLNEIVSPLHPAANPAENFDSTQNLRRRQSIGLETLIHWHEGRADLVEVIKRMMNDVGVENGGWVDVSACGPRSLLDTAKGVVRDLSDVRKTLKSGGGVRFSAETFGW